MPIESNCPQCGRRFSHRIDRKNPFCSHSCAAKKNYPKMKRPKSMATCHPDRPLTGDGLCKSCYYRKFHQELNPVKKEEYKQTAKRAYLKNEYGITPEQWFLMYELQKGKCPICSRDLVKMWSRTKKRAAHVDHDHKTKRVRGLVCYHCNQHRVGTNTVETAQRMVTYLSSTFDGRTI